MRDRAVGVAKPISCFPVVFGVPNIFFFYFADTYFYVESAAMDWNHDKGAYVTRTID
jgi:hypothetical protein